MSRPNTIYDVLLRLVICGPTALETGCWEFPGHRCTGHYGTCSMSNKRVMVHRVVYEHFVGPIPEELELDHLCHNRICANFEHVQAVTPEVNKSRQRPFIPSPRREFVNRKACPHGEPSINGCLLCQRETGRKKSRAKSAAKRLLPPPTHCKNGHDITGENLVLVPHRGLVQRRCRLCASNAGKKGGWPSQQRNHPEP